MVCVINVFRALHLILIMISPLGSVETSVPSLFHFLFVTFILYFSFHLSLILKCDHAIQAFSVRGKVERMVNGVKTGKTLTLALVDDRTEHCV